ncbi:MAG: response regulator [Deltaproteobacteria bacterium]|nr:MAG: response regulator [Deltaproteobacteria bacterium]
MRKRISVLVAIGFAFLLGLGVLTSLAMIAGLRETMSRAEASQASALEVRASVRSLRADYLASGDAVSRLMLEPGLVDAWTAKRQADDYATEHLAAATRATRHPELRAVLEKLDAHDRDVTNRIEDELLGLVTTDPAEAKRAYFEEYLRARAVNLEYVDQALRLATAEVAEAARYTEAKARQTIGLAWLALALFVIVGATGGILLSRSVRTIAQDFEDAAAEVGEQRDRLRAVMEEMEATRDAALEASRIKSEFLANMSHEIRTPMNAIIGFTDLVLETALGAEQRDYLGHVRQSSEALLAIINEVLDLSKIEAGRLRLDSTPFSVRHTLDAALSGMAIRADEKNLELAVDVRPEVPDAAIGDASRMRQVLVNLVGNAIKFTERGQVVVHVTTERHTDAAEVVLHFSVADTGIGIPADKHRLVFDAFRQGDGSMTRRYEGTGLGLTIASRLVEMMGGRIWLESVVGQGTTFHFTARVGLQQQVAHLPPNLSTLAGLRVLVVDDSATVRSILMGMLESWSMSAVAADDGEVALAALREARETEHPFALALLDARMPGMDGFDLARRLAAEPGLGETKLILLTALNRPDEAARWRAMGISGCVMKPVSASALLETIQAVTGPEKGEALAADIPGPEPAREPLHVLVVEDNPTNRRMLTALLESRGHAAVPVEDGLQAIAALQAGSFDVVLMDVQMPRMDGLTATAGIRAWEKGTGHHLPIIALTAHAMKGDRERCIAAGMDAYVSKPVYAEELFGVMESVVEGAGAMRFDAGRSDASVVDVDALLRQVGGNRAALAEVLDLFREDSARMLDALRSALATRDGSALEHTAHQLRGALMVMAAPGAAAAALRLEEIGREQDFRSAPEAWARLTNELDRLEPGLAALGGRAKEETTS